VWTNNKFAHSGEDYCSTGGSAQVQTLRLDIANPSQQTLRQLLPEVS
jgi:hypothetical protein